LRHATPAVVVCVAVLPNSIPDAGVKFYRMSGGRRTLLFMTQTASEAPSVIRDKTVIVDVPKNSRLEGLLTIEEGLEDKASAANAALKENKAAILTELKLLHPDQDIKVYEIPRTQMWNKRTYTYSLSWYLPTDMIKKHMAPVFEAFKACTEKWTLR
jgi:hypothetical protein